MEKIIHTLYSLVEDRYHVILETVLIDDCIMNFRLTYSNDNTLVYFTEYNASITELMRLSELPIWAKEKVMKLSFIKTALDELKKSE